MTDPIALLPKVSLHCHLEGSVAPATAVALARRHGVPVPGGRTAETLYDIGAHADLAEFLRVYDMVGAVVVDADDFHRIAYETLALAAEPADRRDEVIGIGLDHAEVQGPPQCFVEAFTLAGRGGLQRTAHSETGPPANIEILLDELGCSRVDHGYHVVTDARILRRCVDEQVTFTCTPISSDVGRYSGDGSGSHAWIGTMIDAGLRVAVDSDDPPMFGTDPTNDLRVLGTARGYSTAQLQQLTLNAVEGCWLDASDKVRLRARINDHVVHQSIDTGTSQPCHQH